LKELSIVIPVFNSEDNIAELSRQLMDALKDIPFEMIFVNDGSRDNSWEIIKKTAVENDNVIAINFRKNFGQDNALLAGINYASGNYMVIMDDDLQHSPYDIITLYNQCKKGFDVCYAHFNGKQQKIWKNFGSWLNGAFAMWLLKKPKGIYMSPFKIIKKDVAKSLLQYPGPFPYIDGLLLDCTNNLTWVDVEHYKRHKGKGNYNFFRSFSVFLKTLTSFSVIPLRIATTIGFISAITGFVIAIYLLVKYLTITYYEVEGWTSLIVTLLIIGGIMLMSMGLIGEYLGRMFLTLNKKPQYSISEIIRKP
jgi:undecaprenyl-phosphate 4-deoxy-4-formamido-L-arabinose transferase